MNGLFKRVLKGQYPPIDKSYSSDIANVLAAMLRVDSNIRPSCKSILEMDSVKRVCADLNISLEEQAAVGNLSGAPPGSS